MDEHRVGLHPILRAAWAPKGVPFVCPVNTQYEWVYIYAFVNPESGESRFWLVPVLNKQAYQAVLNAFAESVGASEKHHILLVEDNGGFHVPSESGNPSGLEIVRLPPYSPELQPTERAWQLTDQPLVNKSFDSLEELLEILGERCKELENRPDLITEHTLFHWWPLCRN